MRSSDTNPSSEMAFAPGAPAGQGSEVVLGCEILNRMTELGRPVSYRHRQVRILSVASCGPVTIRATTPRIAAIRTRGWSNHQWIVGLFTAMVASTCWRARVQDSTSA